MWLDRVDNRTHYWSGICNINAVSILINTHTIPSTDPSSVPKRCRPVYGVSLLWQPEVIYVYLAVIEQYSSCSEAVEAAAGAIQNLTACNWKVRKFMERNKGGGESCREGRERREGEGERVAERGERERAEEEGVREIQRKIVIRSISPSSGQCTVVTSSEHPMV